MDSITSIIYWVLYILDILALRNMFELSNLCGTVVGCDLCTAQEQSAPCLSHALHLTLHHTGSQHTHTHTPSSTPGKKCHLSAKVHFCHLDRPTCRDHFPQSYMRMRGKALFRRAISNKFTTWKEQFQRHMWQGKHPPWFFFWHTSNEQVFTKVSCSFLRRLISRGKGPFDFNVLWANFKDFQEVFLIRTSGTTSQSSYVLDLMVHLFYISFLFVCSSVLMCVSVA